MNMKRKSLILTIAFLSLFFITTSFFNNCGKVDFKKESSSLSKSSVISTETDLLDLLTDAENLIEQLRSTNDQTSIDQADVLENKKNNILNFLYTERLAMTDPAVLGHVDYLVYLMAEGHSFLLNLDIARVERESIDRDNKLQSQINDLSDKIENLKDYVNQRLNGVENSISEFETRLSSVNDLIDELKKDFKGNETSLQALVNSLEDYKKFTTQQISDLRQLNIDLKENILDAQDVLKQMFNGQKKVNEIQKHLCLIDDEGELISDQVLCIDDVETEKCCVTFEQINCEEEFSKESEIISLNQCEQMKKSYFDHIEELKAINNLKESTDLVVDDLKKNLKALGDDLAQSKEEINTRLNSLDEKVSNLQLVTSNLDDRLFIVEFKAARSEAAASIRERADHYLAWITRRTLDVQNRFCRSNIRVARNKFDYEVAQENWRFCRERLSLLVAAKEKVLLAKAFLGGIESLNVDESCEHMIDDNQLVSSLSIQELLTDQISKAVINNCEVGPALAKVKLLKAIEFLDSIGPDFRTVNYMKGKARIAQLLFFGDDVVSVSSAIRAEFEDIDPLSEKNRLKVFGLIEMMFKKKYVEHRLRTATGSFPSTPNLMRNFTSGFDKVYSHQEILENSNPLFKKSLLRSDCDDCGIRVIGRNAHDRDGEKYFAYPMDPVERCPVINDTVVIPDSVGEQYVYRVNYRWIWEDFKPVLWAGNHVKIANSYEQTKTGDFSHCGYQQNFHVNRYGLGPAQLRARATLRVTQPYSRTYPGKAQCVKFSLVCRIKTNEWIAPENSIDFRSYLSGFAGEKVTQRCSEQVGFESRVETIEMYPEDLSKMVSYSGPIDDLAIQKQGLISSETTQLTDQYWILKANQGQGVMYGANNQAVSADSPFFGKEDSFGNGFIREVKSVLNPPKVQQCSPFIDFDSI